MTTPDVKSQIADMMAAYDRYVKGKTTGQGVADNRTEKEKADARSQAQAS